MSRRNDRSILRRSTGNVASLLEARVPGAKVVDGDGDAGAAQMAQLVDGCHRLRHRGGLGDLDLEAISWKPGLEKRGRHPVDELALAQIAPRGVDGWSGLGVGVAARAAPKLSGGESRPPVLPGDAGDPAELVGVRRHQGGAAPERLAADQDVVGADGGSRRL
jgi:hypothetical protein